MKGHVPTPARLVDMMIERLFAKRRPETSDAILEVGCGEGPFIDGVLRFCDARHLPVPLITGVELNPSLVSKARRRFADRTEVTILHQDYLAANLGPFEYIVGNPPYVRIEGLSEAEKRRYREAFSTAVGRFDLYLLFFEQSLRQLAAGGRLVLVTPEKFEYVETAAPLRRLLSARRLIELLHIPEDSFPELVTYPTVTVVDNAAPVPQDETRVTFRDGASRRVRLPASGQSWAGALAGHSSKETGLKLEDICLRVSCGIATGTDKVFVNTRAEAEAAGLTRFAYPTISGRQLGNAAFTQNGSITGTSDVMLVPYNQKGELLPETSLGALGPYLRDPSRMQQLHERRHVKEGGRAWYRFHDSAPLPEILLPKIVCKDITAEPKFWVDRAGAVVPRHSVYYIVPKPGISVDAVADYLNSPEVKTWIKGHVQRAANGFFRLQANVLKKIPVPIEWASATKSKTGTAAPAPEKLEVAPQIA